MDIATRRAAFLTALKTISGLHVHDAWPEPANINPPVAIVWGPLSRTLETFEGGVSRTWEIHLITGFADKGRARQQRVLDGYLDESGSLSVIEAVEDDQVTVTGWADYGIRGIGESETPMVGVTFNVTELS